MNKIKTIFRQMGLLLVFASLLLAYNAEAQRNKKNQQASAPKEDLQAKIYNDISWRSIGPYRGGRSATVTGVPGKPKLFYMGATGGGVWRTENGGESWANISDGFFGGSIGAVAVSESDNKVIYVGQGEETVRGNVSSGFEGMWKSTDGGKTWMNIGLTNAMHVGRIKIHPDNPNVVLVAVTKGNTSAR